MTQELIKLVTVAGTKIGVVHEADASVTRVAIDGNLLTQNRDQLKDLFVEQLAKGDRRFVLDLTLCGYIDAIGLGVLVSIGKKIRDAGGTLVLENLNADLVTLFELTKLDKLFHTRRTDANA